MKQRERDFGYAGYTGMLELARQLPLTVESPLYEQAIFTYQPEKDRVLPEGAAYATAATPAHSRPQH